MSARVYVDFQNVDEAGRIRLNTRGSIRDLKEAGVTLTDGLHIVVYSEDLEAAGIVRTLNDGSWGIEVNWSEVVDI